MGNTLPSVAKCYSSPLSPSESEKDSPLPPISPEDQEINELRTKKSRLQKQIDKAKLEEEIRGLEIQVANKVACGKVESH